MRIRILHKPTIGEVDGIRLDVFEPGVQYDVGNQLGALLLAERWAEPVASDVPAVPIPIGEVAANATAANPKNLTREFYPPYHDSRRPLAADRRRHPRKPRFKP
jgi:hypothetical protein